MFAESQTVLCIGCVRVFPCFSYATIMTDINVCVTMAVCKHPNILTKHHQDVASWNKANRNNATFTLGNNLTSWIAYTWFYNVLKISNNINVKI